MSDHKSHFDRPRDHQGPLNGAGKAADEYRFREWFREEWTARTAFGKLGLLGLVMLWSWLIVIAVVGRRIEDNWPATYK